MGSLDIAFGVLGQQLYDGSMASLHSESTTPETKMNASPGGCSSVHALS